LYRVSTSYLSSSLFSPWVFFSSSSIFRLYDFPGFVQPLRAIMSRSECLLDSCENISKIEGMREKVFKPKVKYTTWETSFKTMEILIEEGNPEKSTLFCDVSFQKLCTFSSFAAPYGKISLCTQISFFHNKLLH